MERSRWRPYGAAVSGLSLLAQGAVRGRLTALVSFVVLLAMGVGCGIASLVAAWRTDHAYPDYLRESDVAEVVVNPGLRTERARAIIESTPGVGEVRSDVLLVATVDDGRAPIGDGPGLWGRAAGPRVPGRSVRRAGPAGRARGP